MIQIQVDPGQDELRITVGESFFCQSETHLDVERNRLLPQLSKLQVPLVASVSRKEVEPVDLSWAVGVGPVNQIQLVHILLIEAWRR